MKNAKPGEKSRKMADGGGMYLLVDPKGGKYWRLKYRFEGKERAPLAFGVYPEVSLAEARGMRELARKQLANGIDPGEAKKAAKAAETENGFEVVARVGTRGNRTYGPLPMRKRLSGGYNLMYSLFWERVLLTK